MFVLGFYGNSKFLLICDSDVLDLAQCDLKAEILVWNFHMLKN